MKALLVAALMSGNYCGVDVPWDAEVQETGVIIENSVGLEWCDLKGNKLACPTSYDMIASMDGENLVLTWKGLSMPVTLEPCVPLSYGFQPQVTLPSVPKSW